MDKVVKITVKKGKEITKFEVKGSLNGGCIIRHLPDKVSFVYPSIAEAGKELLTDILR